MHVFILAIFGVKHKNKFYNNFEIYNKLKFIILDINMKCKAYEYRIDYIANNLFTV